MQNTDNRRKDSTGKLSRLAQTARSIYTRLKYELYNVLFGVLYILLGAACMAALFVFVARAPDMHEMILRSYVGGKTYLVKAGPDGSGGTGFAIKGKSGTTYIVTNAHICEVSSDKHHMLVESTSDDRMIWRRIIEISGITDLCLLEGLPGVEGLSLGSAPSMGQTVAVVGHPSFMPITLNKGQIITSKTIEMVKGFVLDKEKNQSGEQQLLSMVLRGTQLTTEQCSMPKHSIVEEVMDTLFFRFIVKLCIEKVNKAYMTNILVQKGNSGSPVVNFWGKVVGVVFAHDEYGWGIAVSHRDLQLLLKNY